MRGRKAKLEMKPIALTDYILNGHMTCEKASPTRFVGSADWCSVEGKHQRLNVSSHLYLQLLLVDSSATSRMDPCNKELILADLILIDQRLHRRHAESVSLHVMPYPVLRSDATTGDVVGYLPRLAATPETASEIAHRLHTAMAEGSVRLYTHQF